MQSFIKHNSFPEDKLNGLVFALICSALFIYIYGAIISYSSVARLEEIRFIGVYLRFYWQMSSALLLIAIFLRDYDMNAVGAFGFAVLFVLISLSAQISADPSLVVLLLFIIAVKGIDVRHLALVFLAGAILALLTVTIATYFMGAREYWRIPDGASFVSGRGVPHPNTFAGLLFSIEAAMALAFRGARDKVLLVFLAVGSYFFTMVVLHCESVGFLFAALAVAHLIDWKIPSIAHVVRSRRLFAPSLIIFVGVLLVSTGLLVAFYQRDNALMVRINSLLHSRIHYANQVFEEYGGFSLFGHEASGEVIPEIARLTGVHTQLLDCSYTRYLLLKGVFTTGALFVLFARACVRVGREQPSFIVWSLIMLFAIYMIADFAATMLQFNCTLLLLSEGLYPLAKNGSRSCGRVAAPEC